MTFKSIKKNRVYHPKEEEELSQFLNENDEEGRHD